MMPNTIEIPKELSPWQETILPNFDRRKVFVLPGAFYSQIVALMATCNMEKADTIKEADIVVFAGGADVNPALYGQRPLRETSWHAERDDVEVAAWVEATERNKILFGICRGAQFLHVMNSGQLWQHVESHGGSNHMIVDIETGDTVVANSIHHQMLMPNDELEIIAVCKQQVSTTFLADGAEGKAELEIEAGAYADDRSFFVQGHPEIGSDTYRSWCMNRLLEHVLDWEDFDLEGIDDDDSEEGEKFCAA